ncbi:MAG: long-chain fatty acid--CoA ligase [Pseudomonadota bacterium]
MHRPSIDYNMAALILRRGTLSGNRTAMTFEEQDLSYAELEANVRQLAGGLRELGVCAGDRVGYLGVNHPRFIETMLAAWTLGAVFVPLNFRLTAPELEFIINDAGIHTLVVDDALRPVIGPARDALVCRNFVASESEETDWHHIDALIANGTPVAEHMVAGQHDTAVIMYTSGTTGRPKGAMLTHGNLTWNNIGASHNISVSYDDITLVAAPLFHIGGLNVTMIAALQYGAQVILHRGFDPAQAIEDLARYRCTSMFGAPAMFLFMAQQPGFADADITALSNLVVGAAPVPKSLLDIYGKRGVALNQGYGLTETAPFVSFLTSEHLEAKMGSAGKANVLGEVRIADAHGQTVAPGEVGEILYRGPNVMKGYWNRPEATAQAIDSEGWFHTGDAGYIDDDGFLFISDRVKDMVISGGENVYPAEVEGVLFEHDAIREVAVIGLPDEKWGEAVTAVAALNDDAELSLVALRDFCDGKLARYKLPLRLHIVEALPRNPAGKVLKFELREQFAEV